MISLSDRVRVLVGDASRTLRTLPEGVAQTCVTSPPYLGLRDYSAPGQIGLEPSLGAYVWALVQVFREVRRVLRDDGTAWVVLGDCYARKARGGVKEKDLVGLPWEVAFALRSDGWHLRSAVVWEKPNATPSSVRDRPTSSYEHVFLLSKSPVYYYDPESTRVPAVTRKSGNARRKVATGADGERPADHLGASIPWEGTTRRLRDVWSITTKAVKGHHATFPPELAETCIKATSRPEDCVLDPFGGSGTTGLVAQTLGRSAILCELNPAYVDLMKERCKQ